MVKKVKQGLTVFDKLLPTKNIMYNQKAREKITMPQRFVYHPPPVPQKSGAPLIHRGDLSTSNAVQSNVRKEIL